MKKLILIIAILYSITSCKEVIYNEDYGHKVKVTYTIVNELETDVQLSAIKGVNEFSLNLAAGEEYTYFEYISGSQESGKIPFFTSDSIEIIVPDIESIKLFGNGHPQLNDSNGVKQHWEETGMYCLTLRLNQKFLDNFN